MKRRELLKRLEQIAKDRGESFTLVEGGSHTKAFIGPQMIAVPRHREVSEPTAKTILKEALNGNDD